ncbi:MAG: carbamoyltransferase [Verrucomicrobiota bacterium]
MVVLGFSSYFHDSAAAIIRDGTIVAAAQEERFTRQKHDPGLPTNAIAYCLEAAGVSMEEVDAVVYYEDPVLKFDRSVASATTRWGVSREHQAASLATLVAQKLSVPRDLRQLFGKLGKEDCIHTVPHHLSHAASAFFPSPYSSAAILSVDGVGEWASTTLGHGRDHRLTIDRCIEYPHSLGLLYSAITAFCGFKVNSGEYKLMGLAPYGTPVYAKEIRDRLVEVKEDGSFRLNMDLFTFMDGDRMTGEPFFKIFGGPPRKAETRIGKREMDLAASIQEVTEDIMIRLARTLAKDTGESNLVMAGGVALNCVANGKILRAGIFKNLWIQPAAGDAGGALGAALAYYHQHQHKPRTPRDGISDTQFGSLLGPSFTTEAVREYLDERGAPYTVVEDEAELVRAIATEMAAGKVIGHLAGRMEFGPRSLGARSILGDPRNPEMQARMNLKIKFRESFRPFAPAVLAERCSDYFDLSHPSPYMLLVAPVREDRRLSSSMDGFEQSNYDMLAVVNRARSDVPAVTHVDFSARVQTVAQDVNPRFHGILKAFEQLTGCPVCVNTSFNVRGEPIVCTPEDAYVCFMRTQMDILILENCILRKEDQPPMPEDNSWKTEYELD